MRSIYRHDIKYKEYVWLHIAEHTNDSNGLRVRIQRVRERSEIKHKREVSNREDST